MELSRRKFLALLGLGGVGIGLAACSPNPTPTPMPAGMNVGDNILTYAESPHGMFGMVTALIIK